MTTTPEFDRLAHDTKDGYDLRKMADSANPSTISSGESDERAVLRGVVELAKAAHAHWDADRDAKVGKILLALAGWSEGYDRRADALHAALATQPAESKACASVGVDERAKHLVSGLREFYLGFLSTDLTHKQLDSVRGESTTAMAVKVLADRIAALASPAPSVGEPDYEASEREHLGDPDKQTGIYDPRPAESLGELRHICNLWVDPATRDYVVDRCDHPTSELIAAYSLATAPQYETLGYALAMRVMQSDLYKYLDDRELADCEELIRIGQAPAATEAPKRPETEFLCQIWGEDIDHTLTAIVPDWDGVRRFCVEFWTGREDAADYDGSLTLDNLKNEFDEHEADGRGAYTQTWEIGGVSVERICNCSPAATPAPAVGAMKEEISRIHHVLKKHGKHPGRTDDRLSDLIDQALAAVPPSVQPVLASLSDEQIDEAVTKAVRSNQISWTGYDRDGDGKYTIPSVNPFQRKLVRIGVALASSTPTKGGA